MIFGWLKRNKPEAPKPSKPLSAQELWAMASQFPVEAADALSTMPFHEGAVRKHCQLTMRLIKEVEALKAKNAKRRRARK